MKPLHTFLTLVIAFFVVAAAEQPLLAQRVDKMKGVVVKPDQIDFKLVKVGKKAAQPISFTNNNEKPVIIKSAKKIKDPYSLDPAAFPKSIPGKGSFTLKLLYKPTSPAQYTGPIALVLTASGELIIAKP